MGILRIKFQYQELTEDDIIGEKFELIESISSGNELRYGGCESTSIKFTAVYSEELRQAKGKSFGLTYYDRNYGSFTIDSVKVSDNRDNIEVIAYDFMYTMMNHDISSWFNNKLTGTTSDSLGGAWRELFSSAVLDYNYEDIELVNDDIEFPFPDSANEKITAGQFMKIICELNGVFGYVDGEKNRFAFKKLENTINRYIYPSDSVFPSENIYPYEQPYVNADTYYNLKYEDFRVKQINAIGIQVGNSTYFSGPGNNKYIIKSNQLTKYFDYSKASNSATRMNAFIQSTFYQPIEQAAIDHNDSLAVGTNVRFYSVWGDVVDTVILSKTTKGIYASKDYIVSKGTEIYSNL